MNRETERTVAATMAAIMCCMSVAVPGGPGPPDPYLTQLWQDAWGLEFVPGQTGMVVEEIGGGVWTVLVIDSADFKNPIVAEGMFIEDGPAQQNFAYGWSEELPVAGPTEAVFLDWTGTLIGSTGWSGPITAMRGDVTAQPPDEGTITVRALGPRNPDEGKADFHNDPPHFPYVTCETIWMGCRLGCDEQRSIDSHECMTDALLCHAGVLLACAALGGGAPACVLLSIGVCTTLQGLCNGRATDAWNLCNRGCDLTRIACDPTWVPPAAD